MRFRRDRPTAEVCLNRRGWPRRRWWLGWFLVGVSGIGITANLIVLLVVGEPSRLFMSGLPLLLIGQLLLASSVPARVRVSAEGIRWRGTTWAAADRPWTDFEQVGIVAEGRPRRPAIGARMHPDARGPSESGWPRRLRLPGARRTVRYAVLLSLTPPGVAPAWDRPDDDVVQLVRERAGDRWVEHLELPALDDAARPQAQTASEG